MNKKTGMGDTQFAAIEQTQDALRLSIEKSKGMAEQSDKLIARHREQGEKLQPVKDPMPAPPVS